MKPRIPLPRPFDAAPFSRSQALGAGLGKKRVDGADLLRPFRGVRHPASLPLTLEARCRAFAVSMRSDAFFNSVTAALLMGLPVPRALHRDPTIHVAVPSPARSSAAHGATGHKVQLMGGDWRLWNGLRVSSPERVWCELSVELSLPDLVAVGDYLIFWERPICSKGDLAAAAQRYPGRRGSGILLAALAHLDEHSESPQESRLRVILSLAGIHGLVANQRITVRRKNYRADLALPRWKVAIEYQSDYHRDADQWRKDMTKRESIASVGWHTMEVNADDLADGPGLAARVRAVLASRPIVD
jgi:very-short-patch-repair endonuclease